MCSSPAQDGKFEFPLSVTCVAGTQAAKVTANNVIVFSMRNLHPTKPSNNEEDSGDEEEETREEKPHLKMAAIKHNGCVNRQETRADRTGQSNIMFQYSCFLK